MSTIIVRDEIVQSRSPRLMHGFASAASADHHHCLHLDHHTDSADHFDLDEDGDNYTDHAGIVVD